MLPLPVEPELPFFGVPDILVTGVGVGVEVTLPVFLVESSDFLPGFFVGSGVGVGVTLGVGVTVGLGVAVGGT